MDLFVGGSLAENTKKLYTSRLRKLCGKKEIDNLNFLKDTDAIIKKIDENENPSTRRTFYIAIVGVLKNNPKFKKMYDIYHPKMMELNSQLNKESFKSEKTLDKLKSVTQDELLQRQKELATVIDEIGKKRKITEEQYKKLHDLVVVSLYTLTPPRRALDYANMIVEKPDDTKKENNYYNDGKFYFQNYKTKDAYQTQIIDIPSELDKILKFWLKHKKGDDKHLLVRLTTDKFYTPHDMTAMLKVAFNNPNVGIFTLRNVFLTNKYGKMSKELKEDTANMGTSVSTANHTYIAN